MGEESTEKPFWAKFLRSDYLESDDGPVLGKVMDVLEGNMTVDALVQQAPDEIHKDPEASPSQPKKGKVVDGDGQAIDAATMRKQWEKIQSLEQKLGEAGKKEQAMAHEMQDHRMKMEAVLSRARLLEEEK